MAGWGTVGVYLGITVEKGTFVLNWQQEATIFPSLFSEYFANSVQARAGTAIY